MLFHLPMKYTNIYHILILSSLLAYIGFFKIKDKTVFIALALFTLAIIIFVPFPNTSITYWNLVHLSHYFLQVKELIQIQLNGQRIY